MLKKLLAFFLAAYTALAFAAVDVNKATSAELTEVKGIGPATATRIIDARKQGPFKNWDDLIARVKGIAPTSAGKLSDGGLTINGQSFKPSANQSATKPKATAPDPSTAKPAQTTGKKPEKM